MRLKLNLFSAVLMLVSCAAIHAQSEKPSQTLTIPQGISDARPGSATLTAPRADPLQRFTLTYQAARENALAIEALNAKLQQGQQPNVDELKKLALILAENRKLKEENAGLIEERDAKQGQIDTLRELVKTWKGISNDWKEAAAGRKEAVNVGGEMFTACQTQLSKAEAEMARQEAQIERLKHPGLFSELFQPKELLKMGGAFFLGQATKK